MVKPQTNPSITNVLNRRPDVTTPGKGHASDCIDSSPHFVPPSLGDVGFHWCNPPADLRNHTRCRPPYDHEHWAHWPDG